jgi:conjugative transfer signal peptidase TraF
MKTDRRFRRALMIGDIAVLLIVAASAPHPPLVLYNRTPSMPAGLYVYQDHVIRRGAIVAFPLPISAYDYARRRGERTDLLLLKHVLAVGGDFVAATDGELRVNGTFIGQIPSVDSAGRPLPQWRQARVLGDGELLVGSSFDRSFDSRFFGPIHTSQVLGVYRRLTFDSTMRPEFDRCAIDPVTVLRLTCRSRR